MIGKNLVHDFVEANLDEDPGTSAGTLSGGPQMKTLAHEKCVLCGKWIQNCGTNRVLETQPLVVEWYLIAFSGNSICAEPLIHADPEVAHTNHQ